MSLNIIFNLFNLITSVYKICPHLSVTYFLFYCYIKKYKDTFKSANANKMFNVLNNISLYINLQF